MDSSTSKRDNTRPSCAICQRRKVKCNRNFPCDSCVKSGLECNFNTTKRKRRRVSSETPSSPSRAEASQDPADLSLNSSIARNEDPRSELPAATSPSDAHLVSDGRGQRYVNNYIWNALPKQKTTTHTSSNAQDKPMPSIRTQSERSGQDNHQTTRELTPRRSFILESGNMGEDLIQLNAHEIVTLWQKYMENVDPVMKVVHIPTVQQFVFRRVGKFPLSMNDQSLVCSIFFLAAVSMTDSDCIDLLYERREQVLLELREMAEKALSSANFVTTTHLAVLQALVLYLAALRSLGETQTVWSMLGIAARLARTLGLGKDPNTLNLPPFECEMRRRLWWTLVYLDARTAELMGQDVDLLVQKFEVLPPANLSDSELFPSMKKTPQPRTGATEAIYIVQRATYGSILHSVPTLAALTRGDSANIDSADAIDEIEKLKARLNDDFIQHCDPTVPIQEFTIIAAKMIIAKLLLVAKSPTISLEESSLEVFTLSLELMDLHLNLWSEPNFQQWQWYSISFFPWHAFISLIRQTRLCQDKVMASKGWTAITKVLDVIIPTIELEPKKSLLLEAIRSLLTAATTASSPRPANDEEANAVVDTSDGGTQTTKMKPGYIAPWYQEQGAQPHNALLPGMASTVPSSSAVAARTTSSNDDNLFMFEFALDTIDWHEFDQLVSGLDDS